MTYDFYVLLKFITQHKFNIKLPVDNNGKEKQLALFTINNPELDELKKLPKAPTAKTIDTNNAEQKPKRTRAKKNVELPPVVNNQEPQEENQNDIQNEQQEEPQGENIQNEPQEENQNENQNEPQEEPEEENNQNEEEINLDGINFDEI